MQSAKLTLNCAKNKIHPAETLCYEASEENVQTGVSWQKWYSTVSRKNNSECTTWTILSWVGYGSTEPHWFLSVSQEQKSEAAVGTGTGTKTGQLQTRKM